MQSITPYTEYEEPEEVLAKVHEGGSADAAKWLEILVVRLCFNY